jgi:hypothetical protein
MIVQATLKISLIGLALFSAAAAAQELSPAQVSAVKNHYSTLGSTAVEAKPVDALPPDAKVTRVDISPHIRSASFGHKTTLLIAVPPQGETAKQYWVEYGKSTNHPAALYGPFTIPAAQ